jgi:hypothetical protein
MLSLKYIDDGNERHPTTVLFWINRQDEDSIRFVSTNGWTISTEGYPEIDAVNKHLYVRGNIKKSDNSIMGCSWEVFEHIIAAVQEYNQSLDFTPTIETVE